MRKFRKLSMLGAAIGSLALHGFILRYLSKKTLEPTETLARTPIKIQFETPKPEPAKQKTENSPVGRRMNEERETVQHSKQNSSRGRSNSKRPQAGLVHTPSLTPSDLSSKRFKNLLPGGDTLRNWQEQGANNGLKDGFKVSDENALAMKHYSHAYKFFGLVHERISIPYALRQLTTQGR